MYKRQWKKAIEQCPLLSKLTREYIGPKQPTPSPELIEKYSVNNQKDLPGRVDSELLKNNICKGIFDNERN